MNVRMDRFRRLPCAQRAKLTQTTVAAFVRPVAHFDTGPLRDTAAACALFAVDSSIADCVARLQASLGVFCFARESLLYDSAGPAAAAARQLKLAACAHEILDDVSAFLFAQHCALAAEAATCVCSETVSAAYGALRFFGWNHEQTFASALLVALPEIYRCDDSALYCDFVVLLVHCANDRCRALLSDCQRARKAAVLERAQIFSQVHLCFVNWRIVQRGDDLLLLPPQNACFRATCVLCCSVFLML